MSITLLAETELAQWLSLAATLTGIGVGLLAWSNIAYKAGLAKGEIEAQRMAIQAATLAIEKQEKALERHEESDNREFKKIDSWHRRVVVALAKISPSLGAKEKHEMDEA